MNKLVKSFATAVAFAISQCVFSLPTTLAQMPTAGPEYDVFKNDVGRWDVEITNFATGTPEVTKGTETNKMLGDFWLIGDFEGNMMGLDFKGHSATGYDAESKKYVGTWIDSLSPGMMHMTGDYDKEKNTLTLIGMAPGMDGNPAKHRLTTVYKDDGRVMTMYITPQGGDEEKFMQLSYSKKKKTKKK